MNIYKHYLGISSQIPFCSTPLRVDSYSQCQYSCGYCFASTRQGYGRKSSLKVINPEALRERFKRIERGDVLSAVDEFIERKIPFQLGGMSDPFILKEESVKATKEVLKVFAEFNYPYIISTKSDLLSRDGYLNIIRSSNVYVRFSTTVIEDSYRSQIDRGCPNLTKLYRTCEKLSSIGIPVAFRLQPILPGCESYANTLIRNSYNSGAKHIIAEYLKVPLDANKNFSKALIDYFGIKPIELYKNMNSKQKGREYILPLEYRAPRLIELWKYTKELQMTFGFADNDLLLHSDGESCCGAANLFLKNANFFDANIIGLVKKVNSGESIRYGDILKKWFPRHHISPYLNSKARVPIREKGKADWPLYLKEMWAGNRGIYAPDFFDGIEPKKEFDEYGLPIYQRVTSKFEDKLKTLLPKTGPQIEAK